MFLKRSINLIYNNKYIYNYNNNNNNNINIVKRLFCNNNNKKGNNSELLKITKNMSVTSKNLTDKQIGDNEKFNNDQLNSKGLFKGVPDIFDGLTIDNVDQYPSNLEDFSKMLKDSLQYWTENKRRGVWLKIPQSKSNLISIAVDNGFSFHHCQSDYIMLTKWIPKDELNKLPHYTSHFIGCGGVVINEKNEILLITEKQRPTKWKIPGGANDSGEDICQTAIREVWEETGIKTEFVSILGFRQLHNYAFNRGDIYFVCALKPLTSEINIDPNEIAQCKWAPVKEFTEIETPFPLQKSVSRLAYDYCFNGYKGMKASEVANSLRPGNSYVYHGSNADLDDLKNNK